MCWKEFDKRREYWRVSRDLSQFLNGNTWMQIQLSTSRKFTANNKQPGRGEHAVRSIEI
jgi:hypothetical protein